MKIIKKSMKYPYSYMEEDYRSVVDYLEKADSHFVYMKTSEGKSKRGLNVFWENDPKNMKYIYFKSSNEEGDDSLDYVYIEERKLIAYVIRYDTHPLKRLQQLHQATNFDYSPIVYRSVKIAHTLKGMTIPSYLLHSSDFFTKFKLANYTDKNLCQKIKFVNSPPSLYIGKEAIIFP